jgi:hypothetical protein
VRDAIGVNVAGSNRLLGADKTGVAADRIESVLEYGAIVVAVEVEVGGTSVAVGDGAVYDEVARDFVGSKATRRPKIMLEQDRSRTKAAIKISFQSFSSFGTSCSTNSRPKRRMQNSRAHDCAITDL